MICFNCKNEVVDGAEFCPKCGVKLNALENQQSNQQISYQTQNSIQQSPNKSNNKKSVLLAIIIVIVLFIIAFYVVKSLTKNEPTDNNNSQKTEEKNSSNKNENNNNGNTKIDVSSNLVYDKNGAFLMPIEDIFYITGKGTKVTGRVLRGTIKVGDTVQIIGLSRKVITTTVLEIEEFRKEINFAECGNNVGILLSDIEKDDIKIGQALIEPNSINDVIKFEANVKIRSTEEGGRHTAIYENYSPYFRFNITSVSGKITFIDNIEKINPGESARVSVKLSDSVVLEEGTSFSLYDGSVNVGSGVVTKIIN